MFFHVGTKSEFENAFIEAVGRALCIAQNFESNCRSLAILLDAKNSQGKSPNQIEFQELIEKLSKRMLAGAIQQLGKHFPIPEQIEKLLEEAKDARNWIAHDSMKVLFDLSNLDERLSADLRELREKVRNLAIADGMVAAWCFGISEGEAVGSNGYEEKIESWVFSEFAPGDFVT